MIRQRFREERSSLGIVLRPVVEVILENNGFAVEIPMYPKISAKCLTIGKLKHSFITHPLKSGIDLNMRIKTKNNGHPERSICEQFVYLLNLGAYPNSSDMNELSEIRVGGLSIDLKSWNQLWYYGESNHEQRN